MDRITRTVGTLALVLAVWAALALVAWVSGVLPNVGEDTSGASWAPGADAGRGDATVEPTADARGNAAPPSLADAGAPPPVADELEQPVGAGDAAAESSAPSQGLVSGDADGQTPPTTEEMLTFPLDVPGGRHVLSLVAAQLLGDERPELVVGLGDRFEVLRFTDDEEALERVVTVTLLSPDASFTPSSPRAAIGDVTGDGLPDLVVAFWRRAYAGGSRGGGAWLLRGKADGSLDRPRRFSGPRVMATSVHLADLDGRGGLDVVVGGRGRPWGGIPGRILPYAGGRRPRALAEVRTRVANVRMVLPAHVDDDERVDVVVFGETIQRFRNAARGRFEAVEGEQPGFRFADIPHGISADLDGDGRLEAQVFSNIGQDAMVTVDTRAMHRQVLSMRASSQRQVVRDLVSLDDSSPITLSLGLIGGGWSLGETRDGAPRVVALHGGFPSRGHDGALVDTNDDGAPEVVTLDSLYDAATQTSSWRVTMVPMRTGHQTWRRRSGHIHEVPEAASHEVR